MTHVGSDGVKPLNTPRLPFPRRRPHSCQAREPCGRRVCGRQCWAPGFDPRARGLEESYFTVWRELVPVEHGETQHILVQVLNEELAVEVPLGVQCVLEGPGGVALGAHADFTIGVALS